MKNRYINTRFWSDNWISDLDPVEKLLFLYLLTNEKTTICGIYELPLKYMAVETGIEKEMIIKILNRFQKEKKVFHYKGWVAIANFIKHQNLNNEKIKKGVELCLLGIPCEIMAKIKGFGYLIYDSSMTHLCLPNNSNSNSNSNSNISIGIRDYWNSFLLPKTNGYRNTTAKKKLLPECRRITEDIKRAIATLLDKKYTTADFKKGIDKYVVDILNRNPDTDFSKHRFSMYEFFKQSNGFVKFINR